jgi:hypothetical protein
MKSSVVHNGIPLDKGTRWKHDPSRAKAIFITMQITSSLNRVMTKSIMMMDNPKDVANGKTKCKESICSQFVSQTFLSIIIEN